MGTPAEVPTLLTMPITVLEPVLVTGPYGPVQDYVHGVHVEANAVIYTSTELSDTTDRNYRKTRYVIFAMPDLPLTALCHIQWSPSNGNYPDDTLTLVVDGDPYIFNGPDGVPHHLEAKLKVITGVEGA